MESRQRHLRRPGMAAAARGAATSRRADRDDRTVAVAGRAAGHPAGALALVVIVSAEGGRLERRPDMIARDAIDIPRMVRVHGWLNALGFVLCGLLGWTLMLKA